ncbi:MAG: hypothetical protein DYH02_09135 [Candidatus Omnitrophica bacterium COP1]|nr:hypothetical protein [Candidatus Omnitrophica bacterium COP1]
MPIAPFASDDAQDWNGPDKGIFAQNSGSGQWLRFFLAGDILCLWGNLRKDPIGADSQSIRT